MEALRRAMEAVPGSTLAHYRLPRQTVVLRVVSGRCPACERHKRSTADAYERGLGADLVVEVNVDDARVHRLVHDAGVTKIPAYLLLPPSGAPAVVRYPDEVPLRTP